MAQIPQWLWVIIVIVVLIALVVLVGGSCDFSLGDFSAGGGSK